MPDIQTLLKIQAEFSSIILTESSDEALRKLTRNEALNITREALLTALRDRHVRIQHLNSVLDKKLVSIWRAAEFKLPEFLARIENDINRVLSDSNRIDLRNSTTLTPQTTIEMYLIEIVDIIMTRIHGE